MIADGNRKEIAITLSLPTAAVGAALGIGLTIGFLNTLVLSTLTIGSFVLIALTTHLILLRANAKLSLQKAKRFLIKP
jgi:hypothetical protein